jgi:hypothetical protein
VTGLDQFFVRDKLPQAPLPAAEQTWSTSRPPTTKGRVRDNFGPSYDRLTEVKPTYDPGNLFPPQPEHPARLAILLPAAAFRAKLFKVF